MESVTTWQRKVGRIFPGFPSEVIFTASPQTSTEEIEREVGLRNTMWQSSRTTEIHQVRMSMGSDSAVVVQTAERLLHCELECRIVDRVGAGFSGFAYIAIVCLKPKVFTPLRIVLSNKRASDDTGDSCAIAPPD
jgi:hypothetical protein